MDIATALDAKRRTLCFISSPQRSALLGHFYLINVFSFEGAVELSKDQRPSPLARIIERTVFYALIWPRQIVSGVTTFF
jgi:hypothetical protein